MTPETPESDGPVNNELADRIVASMPQAPRRYVARRLKDAAGLTESEIAGLLEVSQPTVNRDLSETVEPKGRTPDGAPVYPSGRFNQDPDYRERVEELRVDIGERNARLAASREFAGAPLRPRLRHQAQNLSPERARIAREMQKAAA